MQTAKVEFASPPAFPVWKPIFPNPNFRGRKSLFAPPFSLPSENTKLNRGIIVTNGAGFCHCCLSSYSSFLPPPLWAVSSPGYSSIVFHFPYLGEGRDMYSGEDAENGQSPETERPFISVLLALPGWLTSCF